MNWVVLSLISGLFETAKDVTAKISANRTNEYVTAISLHLITTIISLPLVLYYGIPTLKYSFWIGSLAFLLITPAWSILYTKAIKMSDLSITTPMMAFNPIFTALLAFFFKAQTPSLYGWFGIAMISLGIYIQNSSKNQRNILSPILNIGKDKGAIYMLIVSALWSLGAHFSKFRVDGSSAIFSTFSGGLIGVITGFILLKWQKLSLSPKNLIHSIRQSASVGIFYYLATLISGLALKTGTATYVFSLKRSSIISSSLMGKFMFKEKLGARKIFSLIVVFIGIMLISI